MDVDDGDNDGGDGCCGCDDRVLETVGLLLSDGNVDGDGVDDGSVLETVDF